MPIPIGLFDPGSALRRLSGWWNSLFDEGPTQRPVVQAPVQTPRRLGEGFESNAERAKRLGTVWPGGVQPVAQTSIQDIYQQLLARLAQEGSAGVDPAAAQTQARALAAAQFDPQITAIQALMSQAKKTGKSASKEIQNMYEELAKSYAGDLKSSRAAFMNLEEKEKARQADYAESLRTNYTGSMDALSQQLQQLGIEEAARDVMPELVQDMGDYGGIAAREGASELTALGQLEAGEEQFYARGAPLARQEGTQIRSELATQLESFLQQQGGQIAALQAQKNNAYLAAMGDIQAQQTKTQNEAWDRLLQVGRFMESQKTKAPAPSYKGLTGASQVLSELLGSRAGRADKFLKDMLLSPEFRPVTGQLDVNNAAYLMTQKAQAAGLGPDEIAALMQSIYALYGKFK